MHGLRLTARIIPITVTSETHTNPSDHKTGPLGFNFSPKHPLQNGNWVIRVLQVRSLWKANRNDHRIQDIDEQAYDHKTANQNGVMIDQECDACRVDDDEDDKVEFDRDSFSKLLWSVSLSEARLYAQMAYLGSLSYTIPKIKFGNLLRRLKLRFVTSSIEKKAKKAKVLEEVQHDPTTIVVADELNSLCSSPCEWYICDDDESSTRFFVIQGSESLASWQANLLFEPMQFEAMDAVVHRGIYEAAKVVYEEMLPYVHEHLQRHGNRATIRLTGHSLGGSLSLLVNLMLLIRGEVHRSSLLPVVTFGAPWVMCGGDGLLYKLGLPRNHLQCITMHRDIVPRAFSCNYPTRVAHLLKAVNGNFRNHPCLNNQNLLYAPMGEFLILQPDAKLSPSHQLLPSGSGLYVLRSQASDANMAKRQTRAAQLNFLNTPHPLEILTDRCAYGSEGAILRDHDVDTYLMSIRNVISQELNRVRRMRRQRRRQYWWRMLEVNHHQVKLLVDGGREWWMTVVGTQLMPSMVVVVLVPFARLLIMKACSWIRNK